MAQRLDLNRSKCFDSLFVLHYLPAMDTLGKKERKKDRESKEKSRATFSTKRDLNRNVIGPCDGARFSLFGFLSCSCRTKKTTAMAYHHHRSDTGVNADSDDESSSSDTTLGQQSHSSVDLLLGLSNRTPKPKSQQPHEQQPAHAHAHAHTSPPLRNAGFTASHPVMNPAFASPVPAMQQRFQDSTSDSASTTISPPTQTLNELFQSSATAGLAAAATASAIATAGMDHYHDFNVTTGDDLMYDMSQLSQLSQLPLHHDNAYNYGNATGNANGTNNAKEPDYSSTAQETVRLSVSGIVLLFVYCIRFIVILCLVV